MCSAKGRRPAAKRPPKADLAALIQDSPDLIARFDADGSLTFFNAAFAKAFPSAGLGRSVHQVIGGGQRSDNWAAAVRLALDSKQTTTFDTSDESGTDFEVRVTPVFAAGRTAALCVARDITARRSAEEDREKLSRQLDRAEWLDSLANLSRSLAHEFGDVLMGIAPFADILGRYAPESEHVRRASEQIRASVARGKQITAELLRFADPAQPSRADVDVGRWLDELKPRLEGLLPSTITFSVQKHGSAELFARCDPAQLEQVMMTVVKRVRDAFRGTSGEISVTAEIPSAQASFSFGFLACPESFVHIGITCTGRALAKSSGQRLLEPLLATDRGTAGLGLLVASQMITRHAGHLFVDAAGPRTTVHLFIPAASAPEEREHADVVSPDVARVLVVEDDPIVADGVQIMLGILGIRVHAVGTGSAVDAAIRDFSPTVLLLDVGLPDESGISVYKRVRGSNPTLPVIFSTGHADSVLRDLLANDPGVSQLMKPYDLAALARALADAT
jgi:PAS domain S-box-containing protein